MVGAGCWGEDAVVEGEDGEFCQEEGELVEDEGGVGADCGAVDLELRRRDGCCDWGVGVAGLGGDAVDDADGRGEGPGQEDERVVEEPLAQEDEARPGPREDEEGADYVRDEDAEEDAGDGGLAVLGVVHE
jgi:hypothetical protein